MYIASVEPEYFKCFRETPPISFYRGINLITGRNNAGKSALLQTLSLPVPQGHAHIPISDVRNTKETRVICKVSLTGVELRRIINESGRANWQLPTSSYGNSLDAVLRSDDLTVTGFARPGQALQLLHPQPVFGLYNDAGSLYQFHSDGNGNLLGGALSNVINHGDPRMHLLNRQITSVYRFLAERLNVGSCSMQSSAVLAPDASNLADVLHTLYVRNTARYRRFNELVSRILPEIKWVDVVSEGNSTLRIRIWAHDPTTELENAAIPLAESGTGVGQILAMLYILINSPSSRTIVIDEPNSFLHPGAVRVLIEIFKEYTNQHQFILTTHSPAVITQSEPAIIHVLRKTNGATNVEQIERDQVTAIRDCLDELGAGLSEVFGAESVLWVEGPTEERCFKIILAKMEKPARSFVVVSVKHTGDFSKRNARYSFDIYERLTKSNALIPPAIAYVFDREERPEKDRQDLERESRGRVRFLQRRCYENFLIDSDAIAALMNSIECMKGKATAASIETWISEYRTTTNPKLDNDTWIDNVDAAGLLQSMFLRFSEEAQPYNKIIHGEFLTRWLLDHRPEALDELRELLRSVLTTSS